jgi:hypothetical protein
MGTLSRHIFPVRVNPRPNITIIVSSLSTIIFYAPGQRSARTSNLNLDVDELQLQHNHRTHFFSLAAYLGITTRCQWASVYDWQEAVVC